MSIPVSKVVNVQILTSPSAPSTAGFGLLLVVGPSARLPLGQRLRFYSDMDDVAVDFSSSDEEYKAAQIYFSQSPKPNEIAIGRRFTSAAPGELLGSTSATKDIAAWQAVTAGGVKFTVDGTLRSISSLNFSTDTTLNAVAARIQAAVVAAGATGFTMIYDGSRFIARSGTTGTSSTVDYALAPASGTDISGMLGMAQANSPIKSTGIASETISASLDALQAYDGTWYGLALTKDASTQDVKDASAWIEARVKVHAVSSRDTACADSTSTTDIAYYMKAQGYRRTFVQFDPDDDYPAVSAFGRAFTVNFNQTNSTITLKFKLEPGISPANITEGQRLALNAKNCNYYTYFGDSAMIAEGKMSSGVFFDEVHGLDWLQNEIQTSVFTYLYTRQTKVPQTDKGVASLLQAVDNSMRKAVNNGLLAPGVWHGDPLGQINTGDFLPKGYYTYAQPVAQQSQVDREARIAPPIQIIGKGAGALHGADIAVIFER